MNNPAHNVGPLRIVFAGTPWFAAEHLRTLLDKGKHEVVAVYTQPDRPTGRGKKTAASPVKQLANSASLPVLQPTTLKSNAALDELKQYAADLMVVVAYGMLLPTTILKTPRLGCINVHASLLPRWRGAAPIERAIMAGDSVSGVTIMQMDEGLDTGPMMTKAHCEIHAHETGDSLLQKLASIGSPALIETIDSIASGQAKPLAQPNEGVTYAQKISKNDTIIDWQRSATDIERQVRALYSSRVASSVLDKQAIKFWQVSVVKTESATDHEPGKILHVDKQNIDVACGQDILRATHLQLPGKKAMSVTDILNGKPDAFLVGMHFDLPQ